MLDSQLLSPFIQLLLLTSTWNSRTASMVTTCTSIVFLGMVWSLEVHSRNVYTIRGCQNMVSKTSATPFILVGSIWNFKASLRSCLMQQGLSLRHTYTCSLTWRMQTRVGSVDCLSINSRRFCCAVLAA